MAKVLIVDDEKPLREAIAILGDWQAYGVDEVLEATNGLEGIEMLREHDPDVVMVDMKMPGLNGVEFLKIVEKEFPELLTIVISGYNDFEYTRQAIHTKAIDYLLKPVNRQELNQALAKAFESLAARKQKQTESIKRNIHFNMSLPKVKEKLYLSIIERSFKKQHNQALLSLVEAEQQDVMYGVMVLRLLNIGQVRDTRFHKDIELLYFAIENVIQDIAMEEMTCFSFPSPKSSRQIITVYSLKKTDEEHMRLKSSSQLRRMVHTLHKILGLHVVAVEGKPCGDLMQLADSYDYATMMMQCMNLLDFKEDQEIIQTYDPHKSPIRNEETHSLSSRMAVLRSLLETGNTKQLAISLSQYKDNIEAGKWLGLGDADRNLREFIVICHDVALELGCPRDALPLAEGERAMSLADVSMDFSTFPQFVDVLLRIANYYTCKINESLAEPRPFQIGDVKEYIDQHYFEDIKISMFTEKYYLSREYLMKLFKGQYGYGIHEYVQRVRMEHAVSLLQDEEMKIQDIAEMLGYKDKNYFSKAFRNYYSVSPSGYRTQLAMNKGD